jgi:hypothetical protein
VSDELLTAQPTDPVHAENVAVCDVCTNTKNTLETIAAGNGAPSEIRSAIETLEVARRQGIPLGAKIRVEGVFVCPRCSKVPHPETPGRIGDEKVIGVPIIDLFPNREARRHAKLRRNR